MSALGAAPTPARAEQPPAAIPSNPPPANPSVTPKNVNLEPAGAASASVEPARAEPATPAASAHATDRSNVVLAPDLARGAAVSTSAVSAPARRPHDEPVPELETRWYGGQNLIADGLMAVVMIGGGVAESEEAVGVGALGYFIGSPIVHWTHGNIGIGFGSLALRLAAAGVLLTGTVMCIGGSLSGDSAGGGCVVAFVGLAAVPAVTAIDAAVLAYDEVPEASATAAQFIPWINNERKAAGVNWVGQF